MLREAEDADPSKEDYEVIQDLLQGREIDWDHVMEEAHKEYLKHEILTSPNREIWKDEYQPLVNAEMRDIQEEMRQAHRNFQRDRTELTNLINLSLIHI